MGKRPRSLRVSLASAVVLVAMTMSSTRAATEPAQIFMTQRAEIVIQSDGNELFVRRNAPVKYASISDLIEQIANVLPVEAAAIRLTRGAPREILEYVLCVTRDQRLVLGEQQRRFDYARERYVFVRGELGRVYHPLDRVGPSTWVLEIPVSRERHATLVLQAQGVGWPIERVTIDLVGRP